MIRKRATPMRTGVHLRGVVSQRDPRYEPRSIQASARPIASSVKPWQRIVGRGSDGDSRGAFDDLRKSLGVEFESDPASPLLVRASLEALLAAFATRAQHRRDALGLIAFELEDWKGLEERAGAPAFRTAFADLARELRLRVRASDEIGRLGEAQIAAILPGCELQALGSVSERLSLALEAHEFSLGAQPMRASIATAWIAVAPGPPSVAPGHLLEQLSSALEQARASSPG